MLHWKWLKANIKWIEEAKRKEKKGKMCMKHIKPQNDKDNNNHTHLKSTQTHRVNFDGGMSQT